MPQAKQLLERHWNGRLPVDPKAIAEKAGARVIVDSSLAAQGLSGMFDIEDGIPTIRYNPNEPRSRQRFTIGHEIGHFMLNHGRAYRDPVANFSAGSFNPVEAAANRFAACLLMPADAIEDAIKESSDLTVSGLAETFGVSELAMKYRLINLGWLRG